MALGYEVPYPPLPPEIAQQAGVQTAPGANFAGQQQQGGEGGGGGGGMPAATPGEPAMGGDPGMQNFAPEQSDVGP